MKKIVSLLLSVLILSSVLCCPVNAGDSNVEVGRVDYNENTEDIGEFVCNHEVLEHVLFKTATCIEDGNIEYWRCATCGSVFSDAEKKNIISETDTILLKLRHNLQRVNAVAATYESEGHNLYYICYTCHKVFIDYEGENETTIAEQTIPKLDPTPTPTPKPTPTATPTSTPTVSPTSIPEFIFTPTPEALPTITPTPEITATPTVTDTLAPIFTISPGPTTIPTPPLTPSPTPNVTFAIRNNEEDCNILEGIETRHYSKIQFYISQSRIMKLREINFKYHLHSHY